MKMLLFSIALLFALLWAVPAYSAWVTDPYWPPEAMVAGVYKTRMVLGPAQVHINTATLNELLTLPGMTESLALKLIETRPFYGRDDLSRLPQEPAYRLEYLKDIWQPFLQY